MTNLPKVIINRKAKLDILENASRPEDVTLARKLYIQCEKERANFIRFCIKYRLPYEKIGELLGVSKARIYQIYRYGAGTKRNGQVKGILSKEIKERDENMCLICRKEGTSQEPLDIHHIGNPRNKSPSNLISLCRQCHRRVEVTKRKNLTKV